MAEKPDPQGALPPVADVDFFGMFVYDVLMYTLRTCGYNTRVVLINSKGENAYSRPNFVRRAGDYVLRLCLPMRDFWRNLLQKLPRQPVYDSSYFSTCLSKILLNADEETLQFNVETTLALSNEWALFLIDEKIDFDMFDLIGAASMNIFCLIQSPLEWPGASKLPNATFMNFQEELQNLFPEFENSGELSRWLENFIKTHAVPYRSKRNVSTVFYREVKKRWEGIIKNEFCGGKPSDESVKANLGFLPRDAYEDIAAGTPVPMPSYSEVAWQRKPSNYAASSERGAAGGNKSSRKQSTGSGGASKQTAQGGQCSKVSSKQTAKGKDSSKQTEQGGKDSSEQTARGGEGSKDSSKQTAQGGEDSSALGIEDDFSQLNLGAEGSSQASQGAIPKRADKKK